MTKSKKKASVEVQGTLYRCFGGQKPVQAVQQAKEPNKNHGRFIDNWLRDPELKEWLYRNEDAILMFCLICKSAGKKNIFTDGSAKREVASSNPISFDFPACTLCACISGYRGSRVFPGEEYRERSKIREVNPNPKPWSQKKTIIGSKKGKIIRSK
jgi:hypothetical protein